MKNRYFLYIILLLLPGFLSAQHTLKINGINASAYPKVQLEFTLKNQDGVQLNKNSFNDDDCLVEENGIYRKGQVVCPTNPKYSVILVIDWSESIKDPTEDGLNKYSLIKAAANELIRQLNPNYFECAVLKFNFFVSVIQDFTNDVDQLSYVINEKMNIGDMGGATDFNAALLYDYYKNPGALKVAEKAKYPVFVIMLTDGAHDATPTEHRDSVWIDKIKTEKLRVGAELFTITMNNVVRQSDRSAIDEISEKAYYNQNSPTKLRNTMSEILSRVKTVDIIPPCIFEFETDCEGGGDIVFSIKNQQIDAEAYGHYEIPVDKMPFISITPDVTDVFLNVPPGDTREANVLIKSLYTDVTFHGPPVVSDPNFRISNWNVSKLGKGESASLKLVYTSPYDDSLYYPCKISFPGNVCGNNDVDASAGWIFGRPVDMGYSEIGKTKKLVYSSLFINRSGKSVNLDRVYISGGDASYFKLLSYDRPDSIGHEGSINAKFSFAPDNNRRYKSTIYFDTGSKIYESEITGNGTGSPEIAGLNLIKASSHLGCIITDVDLPVFVYNAGLKELTIDTIELLPEGDFKLPDINLPVELAPGDSLKFNVKFTPINYGVKNASLVFKSNAKTEPEFTVNLLAIKDTLNYILPSDEINAGVFCPGESRDINIKIDPDISNIPVELDITPEGGLNYNNIGGTLHMTVNPGQPASLTLNLSPVMEGDFNGKIIFTNDLCGITKELPVKWSFYAPSFNYDTKTIVAYLPSGGTDRYEIVNSSGRELTVTDIHFSGTKFELADPGILPKTLIKGQQFFFDVNFNPDDTGKVQARMFVEAEECGFVDSVEITGFAFSNGAELSAGNYTGCKGQVVEVPLTLNKPGGADFSGTTALDAVVHYDENALEPVELNPAFTYKPGIIEIRNIPLKQTAGIQELAMIKFLILKDADFSEYPLSLFGSKINDGFLNITTVNGSITPEPSVAEIKVGTGSAAPGQMVAIPLEINFSELCSAAFHKNLNLVLKFNGNLLEEDFEANTRFEGSDKYAEFSLPVSYSIIHPLRFTALLGDLESTPIEITSAELENGYIDAGIENGRFDLITCREGGTRLFSQTALKGGIIMVDPDPDGYSIKIHANIIEKGIATVMLYDYLGNVINTHTEYIDNPDTYEFRIFTPSINSGTFFVVIRTKTQVYKDKMLYLK